MGCIDRIYSVSAVIGNGTCNAKCARCAGGYLRPSAQLGDSPEYWRNYQAAIKLSARYGGWSLSLTGSGEPTCSPEAVTKALAVYHEAAVQGAYFPNVNLFTNGILLGDPKFCETWLPVWKRLGLTNLAVSTFSADPKAQAQALGVQDYPGLKKITKNVWEHGLGVRVTLLLHRDFVNGPTKYEAEVEALAEHGIENVTSWPFGNPDGSRNEFTPSRLGLWGIRWWLARHAKLCHGHVWGGGVYDYKGMILRLTDYVTKHDPKADFVRQLVVFQDGTVAYSWIREGALCLK